jgi:DNA-binding NtrC family response regulator
MKNRILFAQEPAPKGAVFVVDDNVMLVDLACKALQAAGFAVQSFCDPREALRAMQQADPKPAVLVTDYEMTGMNGLELIQAMQSVRPGLKTLLLSGTVDETIILTKKVTVHRFIGKPYKPAQLQKAVAELMGA